jgi:hypothetical protein
MTIRCMAAAAGLLLLSGLGCADVAPPPPVRDDGPISYPKGLNAGSGITAGQYSIRMTVVPQPGHEFKWPELAKAGIPELFIKRLNEKDQSTQFVLADGDAGNFRIDLTVAQDQTGDHYGMYVTANGRTPGSYVVGSDSTGPSRLWFSFTVPAHHRNWKSAMDAAADKTANYLVHGWTF